MKECRAGEKLWNITSDVERAIADRTKTQVGSNGSRWRKMEKKLKARSLW